MFDEVVVSGLVANFLITLFFVAVWAYLSAELTRFRRSMLTLVTGLFMGVASAFSMSYGVPLPSGVILDLRSVPIAAAGLFGGPIAAIIAAVLATVTRLIIGGHAALVGSVSIAVACSVGVASHYALRRRRSLTKILAFGVALSVLPLLPLVSLPIAATNVLVIALFSFMGAYVAAAALERSQRRDAEKRLLQAAVGAAPDYLYVKDTDGLLVAYNAGVAGAHKAGPTELLGKSDLDLESEVRGRALFDEEQRLFSTGTSLSGKLELVRTPDGEDRWFQSSKSIVADADGAPIGLVGITRDVTVERQREKETKGVADRLSLVLSQMADGVALYDQQCRLIFCNEQYHEMFPLTRDVRVPGAPLRDVLAAAVERGEQPYVPADVAAWIDGVVAGMAAARDEEVRLIDGRALAVRNRPIEGLGYVSVVSDVTEIRRTETRLAMMTEQLRLLASRDALTGLVNRRALDEQFEREMSRSLRNGAAISALMIDVDKFKLYNDRYGHPAGDACLKTVGALIKAATGRATDIAARYGGEEFCIVLPETDEDGALRVAETLRAAIAAAALPHEGSSHGIVTASIGVATYRPDESDRNCAELLARADAALYVAKRNGRNRCIPWSPDATEVTERATGT